MDNRYIVENENELISPKDTLVCIDCKHRNKSTSNGYKKCICEKYNDIDTNSKPDEILFENKKCKFYVKEPK